ncbi:MAG: signal peptidase II [Mycoplasmataceae bacterium]|nr:signal peptidase II [Mycoplasmataceae bacterium]
MNKENTNKLTFSKNKIFKYIQLNFAKKNNITRLICFVIGSIIVLIPSLICNFMVRHGTWEASTPVYNTGIAFSMLENKPTIVYVLQSLICLIVLIAILFTTKWYYSILLSLAFVGGMFNIVDRATQILNGQFEAIPNSVIDYLKTGSTTSNFPDVFILTGIIGFCFVYLMIYVVELIRSNKSTKKPSDSSINNEKDHSSTS